LIKLVGLTVSTALGVGVGVQLHNTENVFAAPAKVKFALAGQVVFGTVTVTDVDCPASKVPADGLKVIPGTPAPDVDHWTLVGAPVPLCEAESRIVQLRQPLVKLPGLAEIVRALPLAAVTFTVIFNGGWGALAFDVKFMLAGVNPVFRFVV